MIIFRVTLLEKKIHNSLFIFRFSQLCIFFVFYFSLINATAQTNLDSFYNIINSPACLEGIPEGREGCIHDTTRYHTYIELGNHFQRSNPDTAIYFFTQAEKIAENIPGSDGALKKGGSISKKGWSYFMKSDFETALLLYERSLKIAEEVFSSKNVFTQQKAQELKAASLSRIGVVYKFGLSDNIKALDLFYKSLKTAEEVNNKSILAATLGNIGIVYSELSDHKQALDYYFQSLKYFEEMGHKRHQATALGNIGSEYGSLSEYNKALDYYFQAMEIYEEIGDISGQAFIFQNKGTEYSKLSEYDKALDYFFQALRIYEEIGNRSNQAAVITNIGSTYASLSKYEKALDYLYQSKSIFEELGSKQGQVNNLLTIGRVYTKLIKYTLAEEYLRKAEQLNRELGTIYSLRDVCLNLSELYEVTGRFKDALHYYKEHILYRDSVMSEENQKASIQKEMQFEFDKKTTADSLNFLAVKAVQKKEIQRQRTMRNGFMSGFVLVALFAVVFFAQRIRISKEKARSDDLLLNILPSEVATELKVHGKSEAQLIEQVTVLFTDFKDFTQLSEKITPKELVHDLHECFSAFDRICEKYGIEKIKTIGDAYMAAGGLPSPLPDHANKVVKAALEISAFVEKGKAQKVAKGLPFFEIRIGIHTGPVVAGIVGVKKFQYDIWGDTVNIASRMESSGEVGKVNISRDTYEMLNDDAGLVFESRGKIKTKGKGEVEMYYVQMAKTTNS